MSMMTVMSCCRIVVLIVAGRSVTHTEWVVVNGTPSGKKTSMVSKHMGHEEQSDVDDGPKLTSGIGVSKDPSYAIVGEFGKR